MLLRKELDNILYSLSDYIIIFDNQLNICYVNHTFEKMFLKTPFEGAICCGKFLDINSFHFYCNDKDILNDLLFETLSTAQPVIIPPKTFVESSETNLFFPVSGDLTPIVSDEGVKAISINFKNITDQEINRGFFNLAFDYSGMFLWRYNVEKESFSFSHKLLTTLGVEELHDYFTRQEVVDEIHPDDLEKARSDFWDMLDGKMDQTKMTIRVKHLGTAAYEWIEIHICAIKGRRVDKPFTLIGAYQSIQKYKDVEHELISARDKALEADKLKSSFLANISHEVRTPLNAIVGFSNLLKEYQNYSPDEIVQFTETINQNSNQLLLLINGVLDFAKIESGTMDYHFMNYSLQELLRHVFYTNKINVTDKVHFYIDFDDDIMVNVDYTRFIQVLNNLVVNAIKFTIEGEIVLGYRINASFSKVSIFVSDTGCGISPENLKRIFDRFYKINDCSQGVGLGLNICKNIVEHLGGDIQVKSERKVGSRFSVILPI